MDISKNPKNGSSKGDPKSDPAVKPGEAVKGEAAKSAKTVPAEPVKVAPMFRPTDWLANFARGRFMRAFRIRRDTRSGRSTAISGR